MSRSTPQYTASCWARPAPPCRARARLCVQAQQSGSSILVVLESMGTRIELVGFKWLEKTSGCAARQLRSQVQNVHRTGITPCPQKRCQTCSISQVAPGADITCHILDCSEYTSPDPGCPWRSPLRTAKSLAVLEKSLTECWHADVAGFDDTGEGGLQITGVHRSC